MDTWLLLQAALLGVVEGLTEFIPVSSTGHLILMVDIIGFKSPPGKFFEVVIQLGSILAICSLYWKKLVNIAFTLHSKKESRQIAFGVVLAFLPAAVIGFVAHDFIKTKLFSPIVVSVMLVLGGIVIILIEKKKHKISIEGLSNIPFKTSLLVGFFQCLAMIPGVSRSGATIIGSLLMGVERKTAAEFSFFLAIPTMLGATVLDLYKNREYLSSDNLTITAIGFISAFISALLVVRWLMKFISTHGFTVFGWYRIALGSIMLLCFSLGLN